MGWQTDRRPRDWGRASPSVTKMVGSPNQALETIRTQLVLIPIDRLFGQHIRQKSVVLRLDHLVALAGALFQAWPVHHRDVAPGVPDQSGRLQLLGSCCHPF